MATSKVIYKGNLRTECTHIKSGTVIITDAPTDNHGKGEAFSPTDTVATALASCMLTIMGIKASSMDIDISGTTAIVTKIMDSNPRRIKTIKVEITVPKEDLSDKDQKILTSAALNCPVSKSLHPDLFQNISIAYKLT